MRSSSVMGSNCEAVVSILSLEDLRENEGAADFFLFSKLGTTYLLEATPDSQLAGLFTNGGRCGRDTPNVWLESSGKGSVLE